MRARPGEAIEVRVMEFETETGVMGDKQQDRFGDRQQVYCWESPWQSPVGQLVACLCTGRVVLGVA